MRYLFCDLDGTLIRFPNLKQRFEMLSLSGKCLREELKDISDLPAYRLSLLIQKAQIRVNRERSLSAKIANNSTVGELWLDYICEELQAQPRVLSCERLRARVKAAQDKFYREEFSKICRRVSVFAEMCRVVKESASSGVQVTLATNPISSLEGIFTRLAPSALTQDDFVFVTCAENMSYLKPNVEYYREALERIGASASDTLMIGNDRVKDAAARKLGIKTLILNPARNEARAAMEVRQCLGL